MKNRMIKKITGMAFLGALCSCAGNTPPNVLLILADDLGIGGLHCYGTDWLETPHLDRLCSEGMKCTGGLAAFPVCKPSRAVLLSGQYAPRTGVYRVAERHAGNEDKIRFLVPPNGNLPPSLPLINRPFKEAGYATAMYGKWHVGPENKPGWHPTDYGFDDAVASAGAHFGAKSVPDLNVPDDKTVEEMLTDRAIGFMEKAVREDQPFFIYMPYFWIHKPLEADDAALKHFEEKLKDREWIGRHPEEVPMLAAMTKMLDDQCGRLFQTLERLNIADDTIVVFTSDNGSFNENMVQQYRETKGQVYDGGMRVPYIFKWAGKIKAGSETDVRFIGADLYPTLISLTGLKKPKNHILDGIDISPVLLGTAASLPEREIYCFFPKYAQFQAKTGRWNDSWRNVVYSGDYKLIEFPEYDEVELFNLSDDPSEKKEISKTQPEKTALLLKKLHDWLEAVGAPKPEPNPDYSMEER